MIGFLLLFLIGLPAGALIIQLAFFYYAKSRKCKKQPFLDLMNKSIKYGLIGVGISLVLFIAWMYWYENVVGYSAGNAPPFWLFFYAPLSFSIGQLIALYKWWKCTLITSQCY